MRSYPRLMPIVVPTAPFRLTVLASAGREQHMRYSVLLLLMLTGCETTRQQQPRGLAPAIPTPAPYEPGQSIPPPATVAPAPGQPGLPVPPGTGALPMTADPNSPEQARVATTANRLYQANPWLLAKPRWYVAEGEGPGITTRNDQTVIINANLVRSASDGQLAALMCMQLGDMMALQQQRTKAAAQQRRQTTAPPDYYQQRDGMSSTQAALELGEVASYRDDPRDPRRLERVGNTSPGPVYDSPTCARQALVTAGYSELELQNAMPLVQRYPIIRAQ